MSVKLEAIRYIFLLYNNIIKGIRGGHTQGKGIGAQNSAKTQQTEKASKAHFKPPTESAGPNIAMTTVFHNAISSTATHTGDVKPSSEEEDVHRPLWVQHHASYTTKPSSKSSLTSQLLPPKGTCIF